MLNNEEKQRTAQQNRALHLFFRLIAEMFNDAGLDMKKVLKPGVAIPWTDKTVKEFMWRPIQEAYLGKKSTTELTTKDIDKVAEVLHRHLGEKLKVELPPFPNIEDLLWREGKIKY